MPAASKGGSRSEAAFKNIAMEQGSMVPNFAATGSATAMSASRRGEVLRTLVSMACAGAQPQIEACAAQLAAALHAQSEQSGDGKEANLCFNAANLLKKNAYPFLFLFSDRLLPALQRAVQAVEMAASDAELPSHGVLTLVSYEEIENRVLLGNVCRPIESQHTEPLTALGMRLAWLLGRDELTLADNPFRPEVFVQALDQAWREFNPDPEAHPLLLQLLRPENFLDLAPILEKLNQELIARGILPELASSYRIRKSSSSQSGAGRPGGEPALLQQLQQLLSMPQPDAATTGDAAAVGQRSLREAGLAPGASKPLFDYLAAVQKNLFERHAAGGADADVPDSALLGQLKQQTPAGAMSGVDENTIDLLSSIFEVIFRDPHIPAEVKSLIGFLQVPVLKAALIDKDFFFNDAHPARRMIDVVAKSSVAWDPAKGRQDPLFQTLKRNVERVQRDFDQQVSVFSDVVSELESFIREEEQEAVSALAAPIQTALRQEKLGQATQAAKNEVALRIGSGEVVAFVETFLESRWVPVLTIAYSRAEQQPQAVNSALKTMDDLIWSVKPKITPEQRKELIAKLPSMLATLNKWLNLIEWEDSDRLQFFAELAECHASIVRAPVNLSPQRQLELALEAAQKAAERRLEKQSRAAPEPEPDEYAAMLAQLQGGMWLEFAQKDGSGKKVKLAWISPMRSLYIFTSSDRQESFSLSDEQLAQALREQRASILALSGMVDRALTQALETIGANDPAHAALATG
jgi:hypothetical protein